MAPAAQHSTVLNHHRIPLADLDSVAEGRLTPGVLSRLTAAERSRRMLMLRAVAEAEQSADGQGAGPLPPVSRAIMLLVKVERKRPDVVTELLSHPGIGIWAVRMLSRLHADPGLTPLHTPALWQELGYAHCLAAAAMLRGQVEGTIRIPTGPLGICLPTLGSVELPSVEDSAVLHVHADGDATVELKSMRMTLSSANGRARAPWRLTPVASWRPDGSEHHIALEDADLYGDVRQGPSTTRLSTDETALWRHRLSEAGELLAARHPNSGQMLALTLRTIVPLPATPPFRTASASHSEAFGHALASLPHNATELAVTLIHEGSHSLLNGISHQVRLFDPVLAPLLYAPWRSDPRPAPGLLHGAYAFAGVTDFWRTERHALRGPEADLAHFEFAVWRQAVSEALATLRTSGELSHWGERFVARIASRATAWVDDCVPEGPRILAETETADRWATWRIRHLRPDKLLTAELSIRWLEGACATTTATHSRLRSAIRAEPPEPRAELRRKQLLGMPHSDAVDETAIANLRLVQGEPARATAQYLRSLAHEPTTRSAWVGLGLALRHDSTPAAQAASRALLHRPELVRAVHLRIQALSGVPPHPVELAAWIER